MEWLPIESAPKDGSPVWLLIDGERYLGFCDPPEAELDREDVWIVNAAIRHRPGFPDYITGTYGHHVTPTAWQPLPDPPADWVPEGFVQVKPI